VQGARILRAGRAGVLLPPLLAAPGLPYRRGAEGLEQRLEAADALRIRLPPQAQQFQQFRRQVELVGETGEFGDVDVPLRG
jgi:hypothetical protein